MNLRHLLIAMFAGGIIGGLVGYYVATREQLVSSQAMASIVAGKVLAAEADYLESVHAAKNPEANRMQLQHYVATLTTLRPHLLPLLGDEAMSRELALAYGRLAQNYHDQGDSKAEADNWRLAVDEYPPTEGVRATKAEIADVLRALDEANSKIPAKR